MVIPNISKIASMLIRSISCFCPFVKEELLLFGILHSFILFLTVNIIVLILQEGKLQEEQRIAIVTTEDVNLRVDIFLARYFNDFSRSKIQKLIHNKKIQLFRDGKKAILYDASLKVKLNDTLSVADMPQAENLIPKEIPIDVLFEDNYLVVLNKPAGLVVHPGAGNFDNTLVNGLLYHYKESLSSINGHIRAGIVHRLDKDTSGLLVVAKDDHTHAILAKQFELHSVQRNYRALVWGKPLKSKGIIKTFIKRSDTNPLKMMVNTTKGKLSVTNYQVLNSYHNNLSLVKFTLETGRTHQIRVHMQHIGHSIVGDPVYSTNINKYFNKLDPHIQTAIKQLNRQALHAYKLGFIHPITTNEITLEICEPPELQVIYEMLHLNSFNDY